MRVRQLDLGMYLTNFSSLGPVDASTVIKVVKEVTEEEKRRKVFMDARPTLDNIINLHDFEV